VAGSENPNAQSNWLGHLGFGGATDARACVATHERTTTTTRRRMKVERIISWVFDKGGVF